MRAVAGSKKNDRVGPLLIVVTLALLAAGVEIGGNMQPARFVIAAGVFWAFIVRRRARANLLLAEFLLIGAIWIAWGGVSLVWTPDTNAGVRELMGVALGVVTASVIAWISADNSSALDAIRRGWIIAVGLTLPVAAWEIISDQHLPTSYGQLESGGPESFNVMYASVTFGNRNTYAAFLTLAYPFILWNLSRPGRWQKLPAAGLALVVPAIIILTATRLGLIVITIQTLGWVFWVNRRRRRLVAVAFGAIAAATVVLTVHFVPFAILRYGLAFSGMDTSIDSRSGLVQAGIDFIVQTNGIGVGAGGFTGMVKSGLNRRETLGMVDPHNVWIQIFSQYGILVGGLFVLWLVATLMRLLLVCRRPLDDDFRTAVQCAVLLIVCLPLNGAINSAYLSYTFLWCAVGSVLAITVQCAKRAPHPVRQVAS